MLTGQAARIFTVPVAALPPLPGSTASAATSAVSVPAVKVPSLSVRNRTPAAVMHTVSAGLVTSAAGAVVTENRSVPTALAAAVRVKPRMVPCRSR